MYFGTQPALLGNKSHCSGTVSVTRLLNTPKKGRHHERRNEKKLDEIMLNVKVTTGQSRPKPWPVSEIFVPDISNPVFCVREKSVIKREKKFRDGIFIVTQEKFCPL